MTAASWQVESSTPSLKVLLCRPHLQLWLGCQHGGWVPTGQVHACSSCFLSAPLTLACCGDAIEERADRQVLVTMWMASEDT